MNTISKLIFRGVSVATLFTFIVVAGNAIACEGEKERGHRGPPPAAIEACFNLEVEQSCEFEARDGEIIGGTCFVPPHKENAVLACKPAGHGRGEHKPSDRDEQG